MFVSSDKLQTAQTAFKAAFQKGRQGMLNNANLMLAWQFAEIMPSEGDAEEYGWLKEIPGLREWIGDRQFHALVENAYRLKNKDFEDSVRVPANAINDNKVASFFKAFQILGGNAERFPGTQMFKALKAGFTTPCFDGQPFFDADHPVDRQATATYSNIQAGSAAPWFLVDNTKGIMPLFWQERQAANFVAQDKPDNEQMFLRKQINYGVDLRGAAGYTFWQLAFGSKATLNPANFNAAMETMMGVKGDDGEPLGITPTLLLCGPKNRAAALEVVTAERNANGATNINRDAVKVVVSPYLD
jgi:phage major head subunit gpT-like protein